MKRLRINNLSLEFDANQITVGEPSKQATTALEMINLALQRDPYGLGAQLVIDEVQTFVTDVEKV